jgi:hypothetical protein
VTGRALKLPSALVGLSVPAADVCVDGWRGPSDPLEGDTDQVARPGGEGADDQPPESVGQGRSVSV